MNTSKKALGDRRLEKKKNRDHRKLKVTIEKPMSSKEKLSPKKKLEKCPKIIIHKPDESDSENSDSSDEETMGKSKYVVSRFTKKFVLGKIKLLSYFTPVCYWQYLFISTQYELSYSFTLAKDFFKKSNDDNDDQEEEEDDDEEFSIDDEIP